MQLLVQLATALNLASTAQPAGEATAEPMAQQVPSGSQTGAVNAEAVPLSPVVEARIDSEEECFSTPRSHHHQVKEAEPLEATQHPTPVDPILAERLSDAKNDELVIHHLKATDIGL